MVFLNGKFLPIEDAKVPVLDRGFIFGDGIYEVVPCYGGKLFRFDEHMARLGRSLVKLRMLAIWNDGSSSGSQISAAGIYAIGEMTQLEVLELKWINVDDEGVGALSKLHNLRTLVLSGSKITDTAMPKLAKLTTLRRLKIDSAAITDTGILQLRSLTNIEYLDVGPNISEAAAIELRKSLPNRAIEGWDQSGAMSFQLQ
jgi:hypothetical protein